nr:MAG TPA: hypothetical protein [Caudoviricetes sp.]DAN19210.1 MAG TPA: hypothetical protein [Caudoviricetes sp.]
MGTFRESSVILAHKGVNLRGNKLNKTRLKIKC